MRAFALAAALLATAPATTALGQDTAENQNIETGAEEWKILRCLNAKPGSELDQKCSAMIINELKNPFKERLDGGENESCPPLLPPLASPTPLS